MLSAPAAKRQETLTRAPVTALQLISRVTHPMLVSPVAFALLILLGTEADWTHRLAALCIAVLSASLVPLAYILVLKKQGLVATVDVEEKEKRIEVFGMALLCFTAGYLALEILRADALVRGLMFCYLSNAAVLLMISRHWKVSLHPAGVVAPVVALHFAFGATVLPLYALVAAVALSRVVLEKHSAAQACTGALTTAAATALQLHLLFR